MGDAAREPDAAREADDGFSSAPPDVQLALRYLMEEVEAGGGEARCFWCGQVRAIVAYPQTDEGMRPVCEDCLLAMVEEPGEEGAPRECSRCGRVRPVAGHAGDGEGTPPPCEDCLRAEVGGALGRE